MLYTENKLPDNVSSDLFFHGTLLSNVLKQIFSLDQFCDNVKMRFCGNTFFKKDK